MNGTNKQLLTPAREYVTGIFNQQVKPEFVFHNLEHTEDVVEASSTMADHYRLNDNDRTVLLLAAWFHDTGYSLGTGAGHEEESIKHASQFLRQNGTDETLVQRVTSCIAATRMPQSPVTLVEKILCDADLFHLSTEDFRARNQLLKQERESIVGHKIPKKEWRKGNIIFLQNHRYFTDYGQDILAPKKLENLYVLQKKNEQDTVVDIMQEDAFPYSNRIMASSNGDAKAQQRNTERGIQSMFRATSGNHMHLSGMSDSKAHIMISVNSIIISVILTVSVRAKLTYAPQFIIPTALLLVVCLGSMVFAILATRPNVTSGTFTEDDIRNKRTNLLFFGNFYRMGLEDYQWAMNQMMKDGEYLYNSMIKDIYFLGVVLAKKYRFLRISYTIFMWGLIASVIAFAIATIIAISHTTAANAATTVLPSILSDY